MAHKFHKLCEALPYMEKQEYAEFKASQLAIGGPKDPIWMWGKEVVDGKNLLKLYEELGKEPPMRKWEPPASANTLAAQEVALSLWIDSRNVKGRRHLTPDQKAIFAALIATAPSGGQVGENAPLSNSQAAEQLGVTVDRVKDAKAVLADGSKALVEAMKAGEVTVSDAAKIVDLPKAEQTAAVKAVASGEAKTVTAAAKPKKPKPPKAAREPGEDPPEPRHTGAVPVDKSGNALPDRPALVKAFAASDLFFSTEKARTVIFENCYQIANDFIPDGKQFRLDIDKNMKALFDTINRYRPAYVCSGCSGGGCNKCAKRGYTCYGK